MYRFFIVLFICVFFVACSSEDEALNEWFGDQKIATSYGEIYEEFDVVLKNVALGFDSLPYIASYYASLGSFNGVEQSLYFDIRLTGANANKWSFISDSVFYADAFEGSNGAYPDTQKELTGKLYWLKNDTLALVQKEYQFTDSADITLNDFEVSLPEDFANLSGTKQEPVNLIVALRINSSEVLRIIQPNLSVSGLWQFAQKSSIASTCGDLCMYAGTRESLNVFVDIGENKLKDKTIVLAQLILPKSGEDAGNEFEYPVPLYVYSKGLLQDYKVDTAFVSQSGHPSLLFWSEVPTLDLQVTNALRGGVFDFTFKFANPMLKPKSNYYYNSAYSYEKVYLDRPSYSSYDFSYLDGTAAKLKVWYAETDFN